MKIVVIGGTGLIGSRLTEKLRGEGHDAVAAALDTGVNTLTGDGLAEALAGAAVLVDVSNSPSFEPQAVLEFFTTSTRNLLDAEKAAGVHHHVALSVVGAERLTESGYMRAKVAQEALIKQSAVPYSIVHATQFFEFVSSIANAGAEGDRVHLAPVLIQPMAADDAAAAVARAAVAAPTSSTTEVAGPEQFRLDEFIAQGLRARHDPRQVVADPRARYFGAELRERTLLPGDGARLGTIRFEDWLSQPSIARWPVETTWPFLDEDSLLAAFVHGDAQVFQAAAGTWAIHGTIPYNGDTLLAEFATLGDARSALARIPSGLLYTAG